VKQHGFSLVEIAIVLVIIGLILGGILGARSIISSMQAKDVAAIVDDLRTATAYFTKRFNYLPGDFPTPVDISAGLLPGTGGTLGNGLIEGAINAQGQAAGGSEVAEAPWQLYNAGLLGKISSDPTMRIKTIFGAVHLVAATNASVPAGYAAANPTVRNVILFFNLPCEIVNEVDVKIDDGVINTGKAMTNVVPAVCPDGTIVPVYAVALQ